MSDPQPLASEGRKESAAMYKIAQPAMCAKERLCPFSGLPRSDCTRRPEASQDRALV